MNFNSPTLKFSVSGLRGLYPNDINPENIPCLVAAFSQTVGKGAVAIARDARPSGKSIMDIITGCLSSLDRKVHNLGMLPTPTIKAYIARHNLAGGIMISASHNPQNYNAFKMLTNCGHFFGEKENARWKLAISKSIKWKNTSVEQKIAHTKAIDEHIDEVINSIAPQKTKLKIAIDPIGSCAINLVPSFLSRMKTPFDGIHLTETPKFSREPEPTQKALKKLSSFMGNQFDLGFAFDPDADRLALLDETGSPLGEEWTLALALDEVLKERKGNVVINLSTSWINELIAKNHGCQIYRSRVGEVNVISEMKKRKAVFGGEGNGGVIDPNINSFGRDSLVAMTWIIRGLHRRNCTLSEWKNKFPQPYIQKYKLNIEKSNKQLFENLVFESKKIFQNPKINKDDGIRLAHESGLPWVHIRSSNTEPVIRVIAENHSKQAAKKLISEIITKAQSK